MNYLKQNLKYMKKMKKTNNNNQKIKPIVWKTKILKTPKIFKK